MHTTSAYKASISIRGYIINALYVSCIPKSICTVVKYAFNVKENVDLDIVGPELIHSGLMIFSLDNLLLFRCCALSSYDSVMEKLNYDLLFFLR